MLTRRDILKLALGTGAWMVGGSFGCRGEHPVRREVRPVSQGPRYWILILLSGGHDTLYTTDPKLANEVDPFVSLPTENKVTPGDLRLGPHFAPLARWASELTVLNGVQVRTVNHDTGQKQFLHLKTNVAETMPTALDIIATRRDGQPLGVAYLNLSARVMHSPAYFGSADRFYFGTGDVFDQVGRADPDELVTLARVLRRQSEAVASRAAWTEGAQTAAYMREVADFFDHVAAVPPLIVPERSTDYVAQTMAASLERALWLIENDLCCGVVIDMGLLGWDSHILNEPKQGEMNDNFSRFFDHYLSELRARRSRHGTLAENTLTVVGSELGRFPRLNDMSGKDHLPQTSFLLAGPGIRAGRAFGKTGRRMEGLPISYSDGSPLASGRVPVLDDLGATLLHLAGIDPERYGYDGAVCRFLLEGAA